MNYYERHIGDYLKDTAHLSLLEHGVYTRLLDVYYTRESLIPDELVARLIGARSKEERDALGVVLGDFFQKTESGWFQGRCETEIARYREGDSERAQKVAHEKERMHRHREERSRLFTELRELGITSKWDTPVTQLREILERTRNAPATRADTKQERTSNAPATRTGTEQERTCNAPATATHSHTQTPEIQEIPRYSSSSLDISACAREDDENENDGDDKTPTGPAEWLEFFGREHGIDIDHRSSHDRKKFWPLATAWAKSGVTVGQMRTAIAKAQAESREPIAFLPAYADRVLATAVQRLPPNRQEALEARNRAVAQQWLKQEGASK